MQSDTTSTQHRNETKYSDSAVDIGKPSSLVADNISPTAELSGIFVALVSHVGDIQESRPQLSTVRSHPAAPSKTDSTFWLVPSALPCLADPLTC